MLWLLVQFLKVCYFSRTLIAFLIWKLSGLLIALLELVQVERIPDFDGLVEAWIALFGRSEARIIYGITRQFWEYDMHVGNNRRAILDVARARFPIHLRPLVRLLRSL